MDSFLIEMVQYGGLRVGGKGVSKKGKGLMDTGNSVVTGDCRGWRRSVRELNGNGKNIIKNVTIYSFTFQMTVNKRLRHIFWIANYMPLKSQPMKTDYF